MLNKHASLSARSWMAPAETHGFGVPSLAVYLSVLRHQQYCEIDDIISLVLSLGPDPPGAAHGTAAAAIRSKAPFVPNAQALTHHALNINCSFFMVVGEYYIVFFGHKCVIFASVYVLVPPAFVAAEFVS